MIEHNIMGFKIRFNPLIPSNQILVMTAELDYQIRKAALAEALKLLPTNSAQKVEGE